MKNIFIVFEGVDCSGKTVVGKILSKKINARFYQTPSRFWRNHRSMVEEKNAVIRFFYYLFATIFSSFEIRLMLKKSSVVCDRYIHSTCVYHKIYGFKLLRYLPVSLIPVLKPDIIFYLYSDCDTRNKRLALRKNNTKKDCDSKALNKVHASFMEFEEFIKIDTSNLTINDVVELIMTKL